ncbi:MAG: hypothetical protein ABEI99_11250 [Halobaculum sp.]
MEAVARAVAGGFLLATGLVCYRYAETVTWLSEQLDAVGSRTPAGRVEPADWAVRFTRYGGLACVLLGAFLLAVSLPAL